MSSNVLFAVAAPQVHTGVPSASQPVNSSLSIANYAGGVAISLVLLVMIASGLRAAGILKSRRFATTHRPASPIH